MKKQLTSVSDFLRQYEGNERFSGADGEYYGTFEGEGNYGSFSPEDLTSADGGSGMGARPVSKPYVLNIQNTTAGTLNAIVFGFNDNFGATNSGNPVGIVITSGIPGVTYQRLLTQSQNKPFDIGLFRFSSSNTSQLDQTMLISFVDANGRTCSDPVTLANYKDAYQQQNTIIDVWYPTKIDGNTYLTIPILATTTLVLNMFPQGIADQANQLVGGAAGKKFSTPRLSGRNVPIIQTVTPVRNVSTVMTGKTIGGR